LRAISLALYDYIILPLYNGIVFILTAIGNFIILIATIIKNFGISIWENIVVPLGHCFRAMGIGISNFVASIWRAIIECFRR
jgi:hypothetical protein